MRHTEFWSRLEHHLGSSYYRSWAELFVGRLEQMLAEDGAEFANWDQDASAVERRYDLQEPGQVAAELVAAAERVAGVYDGVPDDAWGRRGVRSNGDVFTIESFGRYHLHDVVHHQWDVRAT